MRGETWRQDYNQQRPHSSLNHLPPVEFARTVVEMRACSEDLYRDGAKQGTQSPSPAPRLIPAETENQPRTNIKTGTANGGTSKIRPQPGSGFAGKCSSSDARSG